MQAYEFQTQIKNGIIQLPIDYQSLDNAFVKIIILRKAAPKQHPQAALQDLLTTIQAKNIFSTIVNPVDWQKQLRNEWE